MPGCILLPFDAAAGRCRACGDMLSSAHRDWCGSECKDVYERNHYWPRARVAAAARDKGCVKCGWVADLDHTTSWGQYFLWSRRLLQCRGEANWLEANHIVPLLGAGYGTSCAHHQANLEILCHRCHVAVTRRQRLTRARALAG